MSNAPVALVTGANRGLGLECCRQLLARGFDVIVASRDSARGAAAASSLDAAAGAIDVLTLDVADADSARGAAEQVAAAGRPLDVLINNAGISLDGFNAEVVRRTLAVNYFGARRVAEQLAALLADGGRIVNVSSGMASLHVYSDAIRARFADDALTFDALDALVGEFGAAVERGDHQAVGWPSSAYRVSKAALNAATRILARTHPRLRINAVCPGWVRTDMGGSSATRSLAEGGASILASALLAPDGPSGGFFRDGAAIDW